VRHLVLLALAYALAATLLLPSSLVASDDQVPPAPSEAGATETTPAEPAAPAPEAPPAPSAAAEAQQLPAPAPAPQPVPAPAPTEPEPAPAPAPSPVKPPAQQDLGDEREQLRPARRVVARAAASTTVTIEDFAFSPKSVTIDVGDTVTWNNTDDVAHSATAEDGSFDTGTFGKGNSRSATFDAAGTFQYICTPHPFMKGTVNVNAGSGGESGSGEGETGSGTGSSSGSGSGSSSSSGSSESGSSTSGSNSSSSSGSSSALPATGADAGTLAILGLLILTLGVVVQRRARAKEGGSTGRIGW
jgi:LPXTG-motif cell wall-anchored protein